MKTEVGVRPDVQQELIDNIVKKMSDNHNVELDKKLCSDL